MSQSLMLLGTDYFLLPEEQLSHVSSWSEKFSFTCSSLESVLVIHTKNEVYEGNVLEFSITVTGVCMLCAPGSSMGSHQDTVLDLVIKVLNITILPSL